MGCLHGLTCPSDDWAFRPRVFSLTVSSDGKHIISGGFDGSAILWDTLPGTRLASLFGFAQGKWAVVDSKGRFDTNDLDQIEALSWVFSDDPLRSLVPEIFMRDYYEPRLLPRVLAGGEEAFKAIRPLEQLNRVQPAVKIVGIRRGESPDTALVDVEVTEKECIFNAMARQKLRCTICGLSWRAVGRPIAPSPNRGT